ncbi:hypothetical protein F2P81_005211 [Scophthalmus maximus]|uniref:Uncharacterized protein n=1 Tax=Scophthalmus maximus TaxID=52904 RepID=A0A6A4TA12_SCOMX|nr:hypothetical protein F2P81_005211 [Scophthalmus maximus]
MGLRRRSPNQDVTETAVSKRPDSSSQSSGEGGGHQETPIARRSLREDEKSDRLLAQQSLPLEGGGPEFPRRRSSSSDSSRGVGVDGASQIRLPLDRGEKRQRDRLKTAYEQPGALAFVALCPTPPYPHHPSGSVLRAPCSVLRPPLLSLHFDTFMMLVCPPNGLVHHLLVSQPVAETEVRGADVRPADRRPSLTGPKE